MNTENTPKPSILFWIVSVIAFIWNTLGIFNFIGHLAVLNVKDVMDALPPEQQTLYSEFPSWATIAFCIAVVFGTLGSLLLLFRSKWATHLFVISLLGILAQQSYAFLLSDSLKVLGTAVVVIGILILGIAIGLLYFSITQTKKGILR